MTRINAGIPNQLTNNKNKVMKALPEIEQDVLIFYDEEWRKGYREAYNEVRWHIYDYPTTTIEGYYEWKHI